MLGISLPQVPGGVTPLFSLSFTTGNPEIDARQAKKNEAMKKAAHMDAMRRVRAIYEVSLWTLDTDRTTLRHREEAKVYPVGVCGDCVCADTAEHVRPMKRVLKSVECGWGVVCKHGHIRALLNGRTVVVCCPITDYPIATARIKDGDTEPTIDILNADRWHELVAEAYRLTEGQEA